MEDWWREDVLKERNGVDGTVWIDKVKSSCRLGSGDGVVNIISEEDDT
jgi:hypothetical protein